MQDIKPILSAGTRDTRPYDAILIQSFGGPEGMDDVMPFLENVLRGRNVPRERLIDVSHHYALFDGVSPINAQNRALIAALEPELRTVGITLPIYWGNRNWAPYLNDTMQQMQRDGIQRVLAFVTSAYSSYSGCRQYREDVQDAREKIDGAPWVDKIRVFYNHPVFVEVNAENLRAALDQIPVDRRDSAHVAFTAHSIPVPMAKRANYERQLQETCRLVAEAAHVNNWQLVYQSRSGSPSQPWLGPDILEHLDALKASGVQDVAVLPVGFVSDHVEVLYDLDHEAQDRAAELGLNMVRAATVGTSPAYIHMVAELIAERVNHLSDRQAIGQYGANHDFCPIDCCLRI